MDTAVAVLAALLSACCFAVAAVLQHQAASVAPAAESLRFRLVLGLARRPMWLAGVALSAFSYLVQGLALAFGPLVLVQPVAATDLVFAMPLLARRRGARLTGLEAAGTALTTAGVAAFLVVLPPASGTAVPGLGDWVPLLAAVGGAVAVLVPIGRRSPPRARTALYAAAAALLFALLDSLTKSAAGRFRADGLAALSHWEPYALIVVGALGLLLSQSSFQAGSLAVSLPIIDTVEPVGAVLIGAVVFGERLASSTGALALQALGAAAAVTGIVLLDRSPLVRS